MSKVVIVSGYFNPIHKGHIEYFENAKLHGDELWVIVNSDLQRELKGSVEFENVALALDLILQNPSVGTEDLEHHDRYFLAYRRS